MPPLFDLLLLSLRQGSSTELLILFDFLQKFFSTLTLMACIDLRLKLIQKLNFVMIRPLILGSREFAANCTVALSVWRADKYASCEFGVCLTVNVTLYFDVTCKMN